MPRPALLNIAVLALMLLATVCSAQDHLSPFEVAEAIAQKPGSGFVHIADEGFMTPSLCQAQIPGLFIYTPAGWLNAAARSARSQYLQFEPKPEDTLRALTILAQGCAGDNFLGSGGPTCQTITRIALLSDSTGEVVIEAVSAQAVTQAWQNGFGARATCSGLIQPLLHGRCS